MIMNEPFGLLLALPNCCCLLCVKPMLPSSECAQALQTRFGGIFDISTKSL